MSWLLLHLFLTNAPVYSVTDFLDLQRCMAQAVISPVPLELVYKYFPFATKCFDEKNPPNPKHSRPWQTQYSFWI